MAEFLRQSFTTLIKAEEKGLAISIEEGLNSGLLSEKQKQEFLSKHR